MPKTGNEHVFQLIKSLTKAEKRNFKLFAGGHHQDKSVKFLQLFDMMDKMQEYNEKKLLQKAKEIKSQQLSNLKAHLYRQILKSLRHQYVSQDIDIEIRELIDFAKILYDKGLYQQALDKLSKAKQLANKYKANILKLEIIDFERLIELQYITRSIENRAEQLSHEATENLEAISSSNNYANLALRLYSLYLKVGSIRNKKDLLMVSKFFTYNYSPPANFEACNFYDKLYIFQAHMWYNYIIQDYVSCYKNAQKWVDLFRENPEMITIQTDMYFKGYNNLFVSLFMIRYHSRFNQRLKQFLKEKDNPHIVFNDNTCLLYELFSYTHLLNKNFLHGSYAAGCKLVPEIEDFINTNKNRLDRHRIIVFYYKIACMFFGAGKYKESIRYLNNILNQKDTELRSDIHAFARILNLMNHFELGNAELIEYQVRSTYRFLKKSNDLQQVQKLLLDFIRKLSYIDQEGLLPAFKRLHEKLVQLEENPFEQRAFHYLDIISWLESKIEGRSVQEIVEEKRKKEISNPRKFAKP